MGAVAASLSRFPDGAWVRATFQDEAMTRLGSWPCVEKVRWRIFVCIFTGEKPLGLLADMVFEFLFEKGSGEVGEWLKPTVC